MSTPLSELLSLVAAHGKSQASAFLQGEAVIAGSPDQEIWEHLARHDILWDGLTVADQDQIRDSYLEAFKSEAARRLTVANRTETTPAASSVVPAPLVPEVVKEALEALQRIREEECDCTWPERYRDEIRFLAGEALTTLRNYSPAPSPSEEESKELAFYKDALKRVAEELGVNTPLALIAMAQNNEETYVDCLITWIRKFRPDHSALLKEAKDTLVRAVGYHRARNLGHNSEVLRKDMGDTLSKLNAALA